MAKILKQITVCSEHLKLAQAKTSTSELQEPDLSLSFEEGYEQGKQAGYLEAQQQLTPLKQDIESALTSIISALEESRLGLQSEIAEVALCLLQQFLKTQPPSKAMLEQQINQILKQLNQQHKVELCIHPQMIEALQQGAIKLDSKHLSGLIVSADDNLGLQDCLIKTNHGSYELNLENQINQLKTFLLEIAPRSPHATSV